MKKFIHASNLAVALTIAIATQEKEEASLGMTSESAMLAGWKTNLEELNNELLYIKY